MSAWVEDDSYPSGFRWDKDAPSIAPEPAMTRIQMPRVDMPGLAAVLAALPRRRPRAESEVERIRPRSDLDATGEPIR